VDKLFFTGGHLQQRWHFTSILETRPFNSGTRPLDDCCKLYSQMRPYAFSAKGSWTVSVLVPVCHYLGFLKSGGCRLKFKVIFLCEQMLKKDHSILNCLIEKFVAR